MALLPYDINNYIKTHASIVAILSTYGIATPLEIVPLNTAEPCSSQINGLPFLRYFWMPNIVSTEKYFIRRDRVRYYVMDRDFDRGWAIANKLTILFNQRAAGNPHVVTCADNSNRIFHSKITASNSMAPNEANGLAQTMLEFEFRYVSN